MADTGLGQLVRLTDAERLLIDRRRRGETQGQASLRHGMTRVIYGEIERGNLRVPWRVSLSRLRPHERCLLYRRRVGFTQARVAEELECCRWWMNQMERGDAPCDELLWYWEH